MLQRSRLSQPPGSRTVGPRYAGVTSGATDTESGNEGAGVERDLYALKAMYERGLIPRDIYDQRLAELEEIADAPKSRSAAPCRATKNTPCTPDL